MPKSEQQKAKLLYILKLLKEKSDEEHPVSGKEIIRYLETFQISAERKTVYADIEVLRDFGYDIILDRSKKNGGYYLASRDFELPECKLLVDLVQSSKFITMRKSRELIKKLESLTSEHKARQMQRQVFVANRVKTENESIYYVVDEIHRAINENRRIAFQYVDITVDKQRRFRRNGEKYEVSPWALTWNDDCYYMIAYDHEKRMIRHYRVDRMHAAEVIFESREGQEEFRTFDIAAYCQKTFRMFSGREEMVTMRFQSEYCGVVFDRFGRDVQVHKKQDGSFTVCVPIMVSSQFFGWLAGLGAGVKIESPAPTAEEYRKYLSDILNVYK